MKKHSSTDSGAAARAPRKQAQFNKTPMCELLGDKPARHFTHRKGKWLFVSTEAPERFDEYHLEIERFFYSPASTVDWLAHLSEKPWFKRPRLHADDAEIS